MNKSIIAVACLIMSGSKLISETPGGGSAPPVACLTCDCRTADSWLQIPGPLTKARSYKTNGMNPQAIDQSYCTNLPALTVLAPACHTGTCANSGQLADYIHDDWEELCTKPNPVPNGQIEVSVTGEGVFNVGFITRRICQSE